MTEELAILLVTAATIGLLHTLFGPDHYVPFIAMAGARRWSLRRTWAITTACGIGHVLGSVVLGGLGIAFGWAVGGLEWFEGIRGDVAAWLLIGFGLAYTAWGVRRGLLNRPHSHGHVHADGTAHAHTHVHAGDHVHVHSGSAEAGRRVTPWVLFTIFVFGPCEPLIPILMYPAAQGSWWGVWLVALVFGVVTVATMLGVVTVGYVGVSRLAFRGLERYSHALAGMALLACGLAIQFGL
jgi:sulfite exporter TauE/SafE